MPNVSFKSTPVINEQVAQFYIGQPVDLKIDITGGERPYRGIHIDPEVILKFKKVGIKIEIDDYHSHAKVTIKSSSITTEVEADILILVTQKDQTVADYQFKFIAKKPHGEGLTIPQRFPRARSGCAYTYTLTVKNEKLPSKIYTYAIENSLKPELKKHGLDFTNGILSGTPISKEGTGFILSIDVLDGASKVAQVSLPFNIEPEFKFIINPQSSYKDEGGSIIVEAAKDINFDGISCTIDNHIDISNIDVSVNGVIDQKFKVDRSKLNNGIILITGDISELAKAFNADQKKEVTINLHDKIDLGHENIQKIKFNFIVVTPLKYDIKFDAGNSTNNVVGFNPSNINPVDTNSSFNLAFKVSGGIKPYEITVTSGDFGITYAFDNVKSLINIKGNIKPTINLESGVIDDKFLNKIGIDIKVADRFSSKSNLKGSLYFNLIPKVALPVGSINQDFVDPAYVIPSNTSSNNGIGQQISLRRGILADLETLPDYPKKLTAKLGTITDNKYDWVKDTAQHTYSAYLKNSKKSLDDLLIKIEQLNEGTTLVIKTYGRITNPSTLSIPFSISSEYGESTKAYCFIKIEPQLPVAGHGISSTKGSQGGIIIDLYEKSTGKPFDGVAIEAKTHKEISKVCTYIINENIMTITPTSDFIGDFPIKFYLIKGEFVSSGEASAHFTGINN